MEKIKQSVLHNKKALVLKHLNVRQNDKESCQLPHLERQGRQDTHSVNYTHTHTDTQNENFSVFYFIQFYF